MLHVDADLVNADWPKRTPDVFPLLAGRAADVDFKGHASLLGAAGFDPNQPRDKDGKWGGGGGSNLSPDEVAAEVTTQERLAAAQTNQLAHPPFLLGDENDRGRGETQRYLAAYGQEFTAAKLPAGIKRGEPKECYRNTSLLVMEHPELTYAEGVAYSNGLPFMHAWAVTADGTVVDPTWEHPERSKYFGVRYDRMKYLKTLYKQRLYGVLGADYKAATRAISTGGKDLR